MTCERFNTGPLTGDEEGDMRTLSIQLKRVYQLVSPNFYVLVDGIDPQVREPFDEERVQAIANELLEAIMALAKDEAGMTADIERGFHQPTDEINQTALLFRHAGFVMCQSIHDVIWMLDMLLKLKIDSGFLYPGLTISGRTDYSLWRTGDRMRDTEVARLASALRFRYRDLSSDAFAAIRSRILEGLSKPPLVVYAWNQNLGERKPVDILLHWREDRYEDEMDPMISQLAQLKRKMRQLSDRLLHMLLMQFVEVLERHDIHEERFFITHGFSLKVFEFVYAEYQRRLKRDQSQN